MTEADRRPGPCRTIGRSLVAGVGLVALFGSLPALLEATDPLPSRADAIYVFPGGLPERPRCAAELHRRGIAPKVVFTGGRTDPTLAALGIAATDAEVGARVAQSAGMPADGAVVLSEGTSTWEDTAIVADWARRNGVRSIVAVTSPLHSRRARRSLRIALGPGGAEVALAACGEQLRLRDRWWTQEAPLIAVTNEALKMVLYGIRHFLPVTLGVAPGAPRRPLADSRAEPE